MAPPRIRLPTFLSSFSFGGPWQKRGIEKLPAHLDLDDALCGATPGKQKHRREHARRRRANKLQSR